MGQFDSFADFIAMGDYGIYVWSAFGATFLCLAILTWHTFYVRKTLKREALKQLARLERIQAARAKRSGSGVGLGGGEGASGAEGAGERTL